MKKVTIYTTPTCHFCDMTKEFFKQNNIEYIEKNVAVDANAAHEMIYKSDQMSVPVIMVGQGSNEKIIIGFEQPHLSKALGLSM